MSALFKKLTKEDFINKANFLHGNRYNYEKSIYVHSKNNHINLLRIPYTKFKNINTILTIAILEKNYHN